MSRGRGEGDESTDSSGDVQSLSPMSRVTTVLATPERQDVLPSAACEMVRAVYNNVTLMMATGVSRDWR